MELHITFGWHLDGPSYPESTAVGMLAVGPIGMLSQLCLRLGLTERFPAQSVRIAEFMSRIGEHDDGEQFYSQSFKTDSWGTAKALLSMRDELMGSGWNPHHDATGLAPSNPVSGCQSASPLSDEQAAVEVPDRLRSLAQLCRLQGAPDRNRNLVCLGDMISPIFERLEKVDRIDIDRITLIDQESLLPPVWQRLFAILRKKNVIVEPWAGSFEKVNGNTPPSERLIRSDSDITEVARMFKGQSLANFKGIEGEKEIERETDIERLRAFLHSNKRNQFTGDGTLVVLESDDEVQAADVVSTLLATFTESPNAVNRSIVGNSVNHPVADTAVNHSAVGATALSGRTDWELGASSGTVDDIVLIRGSSTSFIDQLLAKMNLPVLGGADKSPHRGYMQTLPLALELLWKPFDPQKMIEFLMLPKGPVSPRIASYFIKSLKANPGIGGSAWQKAWENTETRLVELARNETATSQSGSELENNAVDETALQERVAERLRRLKEWLEPTQLFDARDGVPTSVVIDVCNRVRQHALSRVNTLEDSLDMIQLQVFAITAIYSETLAATVSASQSDSISRSQLLRMIESAMADGYAPVAPHASLWTPVDHPGQIFDSADTVIWWGFVDFESHGFSNPWSKAETEYLSTQGVLLDSPQNFVVREAKSWARPIDAGVKRLLLVKPRTVAGRTVAAHPFFHEIAAAFESTPHTVRNQFVKQAHQIYTRSETELLGQRIKSEKLTRRVPPSPRPIWKTKPRTLSPRVESATSLERLLGCPMSWLLKYEANLQVGNLLSITSGEQLSGILAHEVLSGVFDDENWHVQDDIEGKANHLFDQLCPQIAAPLLLPGSSLERQRLKKAIAEAAVNLSGLIKQAGFSSVTSETDKDAIVDGVALTGRIDLVLKHPDNHDYVIDLKWSRRGPHRRREISEGRSIQLALYSNLLKRETGIPTSGGYYMIGQRQLFSASREPFPQHTFVDGPDLDHTFASVLSNSNKHLVHLQAGSIYATGLTSSEETSDTLEDVEGVDIFSDDDPEERPFRVPDITMALEPPCRICDFGRLCGKKGFNS